MNELTTEAIKGLLQTAKEAELNVKPRTLDNATIQGLLNNAKQAEAVTVETPQASLLDAFMATLPSQVWLGAHLAALWTKFPLVALVAIVLISVVY